MNFNSDINNQSLPPSESQVVQSVFSASFAIFKSLIVAFIIVLIGFGKFIFDNKENMPLPVESIKNWSSWWVWILGGVVAFIAILVSCFIRMRIRKFIFYKDKFDYVAGFGALAKTESISYGTIINVRKKQGILNKMFGFTDIYVDLPQSFKKHILVMRSIAHGDEIYGWILNKIHSYQNRKSATNSDSF